MKKIIDTLYFPMKYTLIVFFLIISVISCDDKNETNKAEMIKLGYYPPFNKQHFEIIANLESKYLLFYNPSEYLIPPPPSPPKNANSIEIEKIRIEHQKFIDDNPKLEPEYIELSEGEINVIQKIIATFSSSDFEQDENKHPLIDGANTNTVILFKNHKLYSIGGYEGTNKDREIELFSKLVSIYKQKSESKINRKYFEKH